MANWMRRTLSVLPLLWSAMMLMLLVPSMAQANCIDYGDYVHWVGGVDTPGSAYGVAVSGTVAYVAGGSGLQVIDVSNPAAPEARFRGYAQTGSVAVIPSPKCLPAP